MLYVLMWVDVCCSEDMRASRESWFSGFAEGGGVKHLYSVFMTGLKTAPGLQMDPWLFVMRNHALGSIQRYLAINENGIPSLLDEKKTDAKARGANRTAFIARVLTALSDATIAVSPASGKSNAFSKLSPKFVGDGCGPAIEAAWALLAATIKAYATNSPDVILTQIYEYKQLEQSMCLLPRGHWGVGYTSNVVCVVVMCSRSRRYSGIE